ncbi:MAG: sporulation protein YqfD [Oscillospiraceae bacterium]|nr:sporulation protein YqfD [Oscillospiraceae bacterium]
MFNNIRGVITFEAVAPEPEEFLNCIRQSPAAVTDLKCRGGRVTGKLYRTDFPSVKDLAEKMGAQISISKARGGVFTIRRYKHRYGIIAGAVLAAAMVFYLSNIVLAVEIYGNETLTDKQIESILSDNGIRIGAFLPGIDLRDAERRVVSSVDKIAWIGIRSSGCIVQAEISEIEEPPEMIPTSVPCNVISAKDAQIVEIRSVRAGMLVPMLGDGVRKGDILISGTVEDGKGGVYLAHSIGEIIGRYDERVTFEQSYNDEFSHFTDKITRKYLEFFGLKVPLYIGRNNFEQFEYDEDMTYLQLLNIKLPIGIMRSEYRLYETESIEYSPEKAKQLLEEKIRMYEINFFEGEDITIINKEVQVSENEDGVSASVKYTLESDIGITKEIMAK